MHEKRLLGRGESGPDVAGLPNQREPSPTDSPCAPLLRQRIAATLKAFFARQRPATLVVLWLGYLLLIGLIDVYTGRNLSFGVFYLVPVPLAAWYLGRAGGLAFAGLATFVWCLSDRITSLDLAIPVSLWNFISRCSVFAVVALAATRVRELQAGLEDLVKKRSQQLQVEALERIGVERQILAISNREQQRIGQELHDSLGQYLAGIAFRSKALEQSLTEQHAPLADDACELTGLAREAIRQVRSLARVLDPLELDDNDLLAALQNLAAETARSHGIACTIECKGSAEDCRVNKETALALYRIAQEAIRNAVTHGAADRILIELTPQASALRLNIADQGKGFALGQQTSSGMGLHIMRYRAEAIGASLEIRSTPGHGTSVCCLVPSASTPSSPAKSEASYAHVPATQET